MFRTVLAIFSSALQRMLAPGVPLSMANYPYQDTVTILCRRCEFRHETTVQAMAFKWGNETPCSEIESKLRAECKQGERCRKFFAEPGWKMADSSL